MPTFEGGPAKPVSVQASGRRQGGAAIPVAVVNDGRAVDGGPAQPVYVVNSGPVQGGPALPVVAASGAQASRVAAGPAIPVYVVSGSLGGGSSGCSAVPTNPIAGRTLTFYDEFCGSMLDTSKWLAVPPANENGGHAYEPGELQANITSAITEGGGLLTITARQVNPPGPQVDGLDYTSGSPSTYGIFSQAYGRWEIRCKIPSGSGLWPAFWLYPADPNLTQGNNLVPELDVMEIFGNAPNQLSIGWRAYDGVWDKTLLVLSDLSLDYHIFACEWSLNQIEWFLDGVSIFTATREIGSQPLYLIIQLSLGGSAGVPDAGALPAPMLIDYVRVYATQDAFTPNTYSPFFWMRADKTTGLSNNDPIASAVESSGFILTGTQATSGKRPLYKTNVVNGAPAFLFDGSNDVLDTPSVPHNIGTGDFTYWAVANSSDVTGATYRCLMGRGFAPGFYILNTHPHIYWLGDKPFSTVLTNNTFYLLWFERVSGTIRCYVNGTLDATTYSVSTSWANGALNIGDDGSSPFNGNIAEQALYNKSFTTTERQQFDAYVSSRYGIF